MLIKFVDICLIKEYNNFFLLFFRIKGFFTIFALYASLSENLMSGEFFFFTHFGHFS